MKDGYGGVELVMSHPDHAELFLDWREDETTRRYNPLEPLGLDACRERLFREGRDLSEFGHVDAFCWFVRHGKEIVGSVSVRGINRKMMVAEIGYGIASKHRGMGIGTAAVSLMITQVFDHTPLRRLTAYVHEENVASCRLLERLGFTREGLLREHILIQGTPVNEVLYGLLAREWNGRAGAES